MDSLNIVAVISRHRVLAAHISTTLTDYVDGGESPPAEVPNLLREVTALRQVLGEFVLFLQEDTLNGSNFERTSVLIEAIQSCKYQLEWLCKRLEDLSDARSNKTLPGRVTRMKWPLKNEEVQQTIVALQSFAQLFQFSMLRRNFELMSQTSSDVISRLDEDQQNLENLCRTLESMSISVPADLQKHMFEISEIKMLVSKLHQFSFPEVNNMSLGVSDVPQRLQDNEFLQIIPLISPLPFHKRHHEVRQHRIKGTGTWFLRELAFQKWSDSESDNGNTSSILACSGLLGAGKSVICSLVIDHLEVKFSSDHGVCVVCLYCDFVNDGEQTTVNMIGALLNQAIARLNTRGLLPTDAVSTLREHRLQQKRLDLEVACRLLGETVRQLRRFYICIDALDECNEEHRKAFIQSLAEISTKCNRPGLIRVFFTTRPHIKWKDLIRRNPGIGSLDHIPFKAHPEDIRKYVAHVIDTEDHYDCMNYDLRNEILDTITANSDGMFIFAVLKVNAVLDAITISRRRRALHNMHVELGPVFEKTIHRIENQGAGRSKQAMNILKWTFLAQRPLTVEELRHALSVEIDSSNVRPGNLPIEYNETLDWENFPSEESLIDWCLGLVIIDEETSTVRLVHKSLHDYLTQLYEDGRIFPNGHTEIALTCLQYMLFNDDKHKMDATQTQASREMIDQRRHVFHLLDYATDNFGKHLSDQSECTVNMIHGFFPDIINLNSISTGVRSTFLSPFCDRHRDSYIDEHEYIPSSQIHLRLQFAISCGLENAFKTLLNSSDPGIDCNTKLGGSTMLLQASRVGNESIVCLLLMRNVDVNLADENGRTALSHASLNGHHSVVRLLLQMDGIDLNSKDENGLTALSHACSNGHDSVVKFLLQIDGIDLNSKDENGLTALSHASINGHDSVMRLLIHMHGIDISSKDQNGRTALSHASSNCHEMVVKLLLHADGIDINSKDEKGLTALSHASINGHDSVVQLLLQAEGIDMNSKDVNRLSALSYASSNGHDSVVKLLLQAPGIDINSRDNDGHTAISRAYEGGHHATAQLLLAAGAMDIDSR